MPTGRSSSGFSKAYALPLPTESKLVFHGSPVKGIVQFDLFAPSMASRGQLDSNKGVIWFHTAREEAVAYARGRTVENKYPSSEGGEVYECRLSFRKPNLERSSQSFSMGRRAAAIERARARGCDGVIFRYSSRSETDARWDQLTEYAVLDLSAIKRVVVQKSVEQQADEAKAYFDAAEILRRYDPGIRKPGPIEVVDAYLPICEAQEGISDSISFSL